MSATAVSPPLPAAEARAAVRPAFAVLVLAMLPAVLDQTVVATALPVIAGQLGSVGDVSTIVTAYVLASTVSAPLWGKLGDRHDRRTLLGVALVVFLAASALCGLAQSLAELVAARTVQGLGAGGLIVLAMASVGDLVPPRERARWQGRIATVFAAATVAGPLVGGALVDHAGWRWVFYVNLPVGLLALVGARMVLPSSGGAQPSGAVGPRAPLDVAGATVLSVAGGSGLLALLGTGSAPVTVALAMSAVAFGAAFAIRERRAADPLVPLALLAKPPVRVASAGLLLATAALFGVTVFVPVLAQAGAGFGATEAGLLLATMTIGLTASTTVAGRWIAKTGRLRRLPPAGAALMAVALAALALAAPSAPVGVIVAALVVFGAGFGLTTQLLTVAVQNSVDRAQLGVATATTTFFRAFGGASGAAVLGAVFAAAGGTVGDAAQAAFAVAAGIAGVATLALLALPATVDRDLEEAS